MTSRHMLFIRRSVISMSIINDAFNYINQIFSFHY